MESQHLKVEIWGRMLFFRQQRGPLSKIQEPLTPMESGTTEKRKSEAMLP